MAYTFQPGKMYRMPTHFGPLMGPRQGPDGRKFECLDNPKNTSISVSFLSNAEQLEALLPDCFALGEQPIVTVYATYMKEIEWLAGRGYNILGVTFPAVFNGTQDHVQGAFLSVLWENLCDPIITGREELGFSKIYCELPEPRITQNEAQAMAGWLGFSFLDISVTNLISNAGNATPAQSEKVDGTLHYKYMPKTGEWGTEDIAYPVITPATGGHRKVLEHLTGDGIIVWNKARWQDLPTMYNIINALADLEVVKYLGGSLTRSIGAKDISDQRILR